MALTADRLASLDNEYISASATSDESDPSPLEKLQRAKHSVYAVMRSLYYVGPEGRRILRDDELRIYGEYDVRFRDNSRQTQEMDNLEYWEGKERFFESQLRRSLQTHPPAPQSTDLPGGPHQAQRISFGDRLSRLERMSGAVKAWASSVENPAQLGPSSTSGSSFLCPADPPRDGVDPLPTPPTPLNQTATPDEHNRRSRKRQRPRLDQSDEEPRSKKPANRSLSRPTEGTTGVGEPISKTIARGKTATRARKDLVPLRRSARIAALPRQKYCR